MIPAVFRPIDRAKPLADRQGWLRSPWSATWMTTLDLLEREIRHLAGKNIIIEIDTTLDQIRNDGWPYSSARIGRPGVRISFESKHGPLAYTSVQYARWEANVHAIAMTLERLRAVERYGCVKQAEQYRGFSALPQTIQASEWATVEGAAAFLLRTEGYPPTPEAVAAVVLDPNGTYRGAAKKAHPDAGGSVELMAKVNRARDFIIQGAA